MAKVKVAVWGTVGKTVFIDPDLGPRLDALTARFDALVAAGTGSHHNLSGLQQGDDHPQYTMWQANETIAAPWNFEVIPFIQGETLAEYIEDVVGGSFAEFLEDTSSVVWTYHDTAQLLEANVPPEFVQDTVGAMLLDTTSIDLTYNDGTGQFSAAIIDEYVQDLVGAMLVDSTSIDFTYSDAAGTFTAVVLPAGVNHDLLLNYVADQHVAHSGVTLTAGAGLTGGGTIAASRTFAVGAGTGITVNADDVAIANTAVTPGSYTYASLTVDQQGRLTAASSGSAPAALANPSGLIGMSAVNGVATTALRSDGLHAIDPAIAPTWTATHTFSNVPVVPNDSWEYAKIQNVSATNRVLGRISSGAGDIEELTSANLVTILGSAIPSGANPSASVGLSAVNGSAATFMRSDGAPALSLSISPTWTGNHTFTGDYIGARTATGVAQVRLGSLISALGFLSMYSSAAADERLWEFGASSSGNFQMQATNDATSVGRALFTATRTGVAITGVSFGNATDNAPYAFLGTGRTTFGGVARLKGSTVAALPAGTAGDTAYVTDALAPVFGAAVAGGGAVVVPVYYTGAAWFVG